MTVQELKIYYKKAWLSWFFFPRGLKIALDFIPIDKPVTDYDACDRVYQRGVCEEFEKGLQEKGLFGWIFKKLYKRQIDDFLQNKIYTTYINKELTESSKLNIVSNNKPTLPEVLIAAEKDNAVLQKYIEQKNAEGLANWKERNAESAANRFTSLWPSFFSTSKDSEITKTQTPEVQNSKDMKR